MRPSTQPWYAGSKNRQCRYLFEDAAVGLWFVFFAEHGARAEAAARLPARGRGAQHALHAGDAVAHEPQVEVARRGHRPHRHAVVVRLYDTRLGTVMNSSKDETVYWN
ncbi:jg3977 [Pararge aegeria aegeria]|uniref:Jg3977 protein n=1 Tax=Pararge aegeria aegeria TaxID=348720 RepID=A0A8S4S166_9NEOP|nr:jg3977 [Pararge aegeria aegeria]